MQNSMEETLLQKAQRLGIKPTNQVNQTTQPTQPVNPIETVQPTETLLQKAQRLGIKPVENPIQTIVSSAKSGIEQVKAGYRQSVESANPLVKVEGVVKSLAGGVNVALSPLAPVFKPVGELISATGEKIGDIKAVQNFARTGAGKFAERVASDVENLMTVTGAVASFAKPSVVRPSVAGEATVVKPKIAPPPPKITKLDPLVEKRISELNKIESQYSDLRKISNFNPKEILDTKQRIASTDVLSNVVDENGVIRTRQPGGAIDQYKQMTLDNAEGVVRKNLALEGGKTSLKEVQIRMEEAVNSSSLKGADKLVALSKVKQEISGLKLDADSQGFIANELLQDAKINTTNNIDFNTPREVQTYRKAIAEAYKTTIEKNSSLNIYEVNKELSKYLRDIEFLKTLDGKRVKGGKIGKYTSQITGNIVGGAVGGAVGGFTGSAIGTIVGGELSSIMKQRSMQGTFGSGGTVPQKSAVIQEAVNKVKKSVPKIDERLIQEAKKYKTAEEFVKAQGTPVYHGSPSAFDPIRTFTKSQLIELWNKVNKIK